MGGRNTKKSIKQMSGKSFDICRNVLVEQKQYLVMIRVLICMSNLVFWDFIIFVSIVAVSHLFRKWDSNIYFRESAKCKMTAQTGGEY